MSTTPAQMSEQTKQVNPRKQHFRSSGFTTNIMGKFYEDSSLSKELKATNYKLESVKRRYNQKVILLQSLQRSLNNVNQYMNSLSNKRLKFLLSLREEKFKHISQLAGPIVLKSIRNYYLKQKKKEAERRNNAAITIQCWFKQRKAIRLYKLLKKKKFVKDLRLRFVKYKRARKFKRSLQCVVGSLKLNRKRCIKKREAQKVVEPIFLTETSNLDQFAIKVREIKSKPSTDFDNFRRGGYRSRGYSMGVSLISSLPKSTSRNSPLSKLSQGPKESTGGSNTSGMRSSSPLKVTDQTTKLSLKPIPEQSTTLLRTALTNVSGNKTTNQPVHRRRANTRVVEFNFETNRRTNDSRNQDKISREDKKKKNKSQHSTNKSTHLKNNSGTTLNDYNTNQITNYQDNQDNSIIIPDETLPIKIISFAPPEPAISQNVSPGNKFTNDFSNTCNNGKGNENINYTDDNKNSIELHDSNTTIQDNKTNGINNNDAGTLSTRPIINFTIPDNQTNVINNNDAGTLTTTPIISFTVPDNKDIPPKTIDITDTPDSSKPNTVVTPTNQFRSLNRMSSSPNLRIPLSKELTKSVSSTLQSTEGKGDTSSRVLKVSEVDTQFVSQQYSTDPIKNIQNDNNQNQAIDQLGIIDNSPGQKSGLINVPSYVGTSSVLQTNISINSKKNEVLTPNIVNNTNINKSIPGASNNSSGHSTTSRNIISCNNSPPLANIINNKNTLQSPGGISFGSSQLEYTSFQLSSTSSSGGDDDDPFDFNILNSPILASSNHKNTNISESTFFDNNTTTNNCVDGLNLTVDVEVDSENGDDH